MQHLVITTLILGIFANHRFVPILAHCRNKVPSWPKLTVLKLIFDLQTHPEASLAIKPLIIRINFVTLYVGLTAPKMHVILVRANF